MSFKKICFYSRAHDGMDNGEVLWWNFKSPKLVRKFETPKSFTKFDALKDRLFTQQVSESSRSLRDIIQCYDKNLNYRIAQKGEFLVLYNYVPASRSFACHESITYVTHSDFTYLDNLKPVVERWEGPISLALYAPGTDFTATLTSIRYLRKCSSPLISEYVSFHIFFEAIHLPKIIPRPQDVLQDETFNCAVPPPWYKATPKSMYRYKNKLLYPINVGRNLARDSAQTHYIFVSDIELYPSPAIIPNFLDMVRRQDPPIQHAKPKVFPLCLFEVESYAQPPSTKEELVSIAAFEMVVLDCYLPPENSEYSIPCEIKGNTPRPNHTFSRI